MEEKKRSRGRPRLDTRHTEAHAPSRRQAVNSMYMFEAVQLISEEATEIPDSGLHVTDFFSLLSVENVSLCNIVVACLDKN